MKYFQFLVILFAFSQVSAQQIAVKKGQVEDGLKVNDTISETFALYLPSTFSTQKNWPVIFVFDPKGRGSSAVQLFRQVAEEQGYIIAGSNNIEKSDSLVQNLKVATRLLQKVFNYFPIDGNQIYTAGFAEGGEVASVVPAVYNQVKGVISVGKAWVNPDFIKKGAGFSFVGIAGTRDYHYYELQKIVSFFNKTGLKAGFYPFDGGYEWPSQSVISRAVTGFTLEAIAKGFRPQDSSFVNNLFSAELAKSEMLRRKREPYKAYSILEKMEDDFAVFDKKDEIRDHEKDLKRNSDYRNIRSLYRRARDKEYQLNDEYQFYFQEDMLAANFENLGYWQQQMANLKKMEEGENPAEADIAYRLQGLLASWAKEGYQSLKKGHASIDPLIFTSILSTIFDKKDPAGYFQIIGLSSLDGDNATALLYLDDLLKTGYKNMEALYDIPGTLDLKLSAEFNEKVKKYLGKSKYYDGSLD